MFRFIDFPTPIPLENYHEAIRQVVATNRDLPSLLSIYKFGNITSPGISDLDILFVFENNSICLQNGFEHLNPDLRNIFTHGIMAVSEDFFKEMDQYALWGKKELIHGKEIICNSTRTASEEDLLKKQTAQEFLLANYVDLQVQITYKTIKIRSFLQHMKGLAYDLEYLGDSSDPLNGPLEIIRHKIIHWFDQNTTTDFIESWIHQFHPMYCDYMNRLFLAEPFLLPLMESYTISSNMELVNGNNVQLKHRGLILPNFFAFLGKKYFKIQHRLNHFTFTCPINDCKIDFLNRRFEFIRKMKEYNRTHLPAFMTNTTSITSKIF